MQIWPFLKEPSNKVLRTNAGIPAVNRGQSSPNRVSYSEGDEAGNIPSVQFKTKDNARKLKLITQEEDDDSETAAVTKQKCKYCKYEPKSLII